MAESCRKSFRETSNQPFGSRRSSIGSGNCLNIASEWHRAVPFCWSGAPSSGQCLWKSGSALLRILHDRTGLRQAEMQSVEEAVTLPLDAT